MDKRKHSAPGVEEISSGASVAGSIQDDYNLTGIPAECQIKLNMAVL
jgi:hypothetical protein